MLGLGFGKKSSNEPERGQAGSIALVVHCDEQPREMVSGEEDDRRQSSVVARFRGARARAQDESCESDRGRDDAEYPPAAHLSEPSR